MPQLIDSLEDRLRYKIGELQIQNAFLEQQLDEAHKKIEELKAKVADDTSTSEVQ